MDEDEDAAELASLRASLAASKEAKTAPASKAGVAPKAKTAPPTRALPIEEQQAEHDARAAVVGGARERSVAVAVLQVDLCPVPQKQLDHLLAALVGGAHQRSAAAAALKVDLRAVPQQRLGHLHVAEGGGGHQRGAAFAVAVLRVRLRAPLQQNLDQLLVAVGGGEHQKRQATPTTALARRINLPVPGEPPAFPFESGGSYVGEWRRDRKEDGEGGAMCHAAPPRRHAPPLGRAGQRPEGRVGVRGGVRGCGVEGVRR